MARISSLLAVAAAAILPLASAERLIESKSLNPCMANSKFSATLFNVVFTPDNYTIGFNVVGVSDISQNVTAELQVIAYGYKLLQKTMDPCTNQDLAGICPMNRGQINLESNIVLDSSIVKQVPGIAYSVPDLDGKVRIYINDTTTHEPLACVEAELSNGKSVYQKAVGWTTAVIAGLGLVASAITSGLGHSNTAAHVAANAMSLFGFFQSQALIGMTAVELPPIVQSWTQNFQWAMGIIRIGFLQKLATWYQRSTGGTPSTVLSSLSTVSVQVQKRSLELVKRVAQQVAAHSARIMKRVNADTTNAETSTTVTVRGIERVGFRANIELTNIFLTGYVFFVVFVIFTILGVTLFKLACEGLTKSGKMKGDTFRDFRNGWTTVLRGIMFRIVLIGFPQMVVLCFWELTKRDSSAEVVLAIFTVITMIMILGFAASKVILLAKRSIEMHKNPAYILYADPTALNKWGFLYVQYKATAYYFIVPWLAYVLLKGMFVGLSQNGATLQAVALVIIEAAWLVGCSVMRPFMDKKTNGFNIAIAAINFLSAIFLLVFSNVFNQPGLVTGVMGVIFFIYNAAFALTLLVMVLVSSGFALFSKNPDTRYQPMRDDRGSFIKSQTQLTTELDALGATARGDKGGYGKRSAIDDDDSSFSEEPKTESITAPQQAMYHPTRTTDPNDGFYTNSNPSQASHYQARSNAASPAPSRNGYGYDGGYGQNASPFRPASRNQQNASPWQRGAGYDH